MSFYLITYPNQHKKTPSFFVLNKGNYSGSPSKKPYGNCFAVYTDSPDLFAQVHAGFLLSYFKPKLIGSCIKFIRKKDMNEVIAKCQKISIDKARKVELLEKQAEKYLQIVAALRKCIIVKLRQ